MISTSRYILLFTILFGACTAWGQEMERPEEVGLPFAHEHFAPQDYEQYPQNWAVTQDHRGLIYVANNDGILEYDGEDWELIPTLTNTFVRSLHTDSSGTVWAGVRGDFGYLSPDSTGTMTYESLHEEVAKEDRDFEDVWNVNSTTDGTYFQAEDYLFRWNGESMEVWTSEEGFHTSFVVDDDLYVRDFGRGLLQMSDDSLEIVPGGAQFEDTPVHLMLRYDEDTVLVGTHREGFYLYDGSSFVPFETEADPFLEENQLYQGTWLREDYIALATLGSGVLVIDREGQLVRVLDTSAEIPDDIVNHVYADEQEGLWMALNSNGIARADPVSPLSRYDEQLGLEGVVYDIERHEDELYATKGSGLYEIERIPNILSERQADRRTAFRRIPDVPMSWSATSTDHGLFVATEGGIYLVNREINRVAENRTYAVHPSEYEKDRLYVGMENGFGLLQRQNSEWSLRKVEGVSGEVRSIREEGRGKIWITTVDGYVKQIRFEEESSDEYNIERYGPADGLPGSFMSVFSVGEDILFLSTDGIFRKEQTGGQLTFKQDTTFASPGNIGSAWSVDVRDEDVWYAQGNQVYLAQKNEDATYEREVVDPLQFPMSDVRLRVDDGIVWIGNRRELIRYDPSIPDLPRPDFQALVREIAAVGEGEERVLYGGTPQDGARTAESLASDIQYDDNNLRFNFAAPLYGTAEPVEYQYRLDGRQDEWSEWGTETTAVYHDLREGDYAFEVRARDERGNMSTSARMSFEVLPPWYRTNWAYLSYLILLGLFVLGGRHYYRIIQENRRAREQAEELRRAHRSRTASGGQRAPQTSQ